MWKGAGMIIFFGWIPKMYFFQLPKPNKFCLGVELDPAHQVIKKLKVDPNAVSHFMPQRLQNVKKTKNKKGHASQWNSEYMYLIEI